jgi:hypothetical protein
VKITEKEKKKILNMLDKLDKKTEDTNNIGEIRYEELHQQHNNTNVKRGRN